MTFPQMNEENKKVLLREHKRHTARRAASARGGHLPWMDGVPTLDPLPHPSLARGRGTYLGVAPILTWPGGTYLGWGGVPTLGGGGGSCTYLGVLLPPSWPGQGEGYLPWGTPHPDLARGDTYLEWGRGYLPWVPPCSELAGGGRGTYLGVPPTPPPPPSGVDRQAPVKTVPSHRTTWAGGNQWYKFITFLEFKIVGTLSTHIISFYIQLHLVQ